jgi:hypothetical protein
MTPHFIHKKIEDPHHNAMQEEMKKIFIERYQDRMKSVKVYSSRQEKLSIKEFKCRV